MNPLVGVTVPAYEAWNIQYATLTDKAPKDFSPIPGLAESWKGSADGKTWTYKLRPNLKWSDGQPLTAEDVAYTINRAAQGGVAELHLRRREPDRHGAATRRPWSSRRRCRSRSCRRWTSTSCPSTSGRSTTPRRSRKYDGAGRRRLGPVHARAASRRASSRASRRTRTTGGGKPAVDRVVLRNFNNPDAMVAALKRGEIDAAEDVPGHRVPAAREGPEHRRRVQGNQGGFDEFAINGGDGLKKPHPALLDLRVRAGDRPRDRQEDDRRPRARAASARPADTLSPSAEPGVDRPKIRRRPALRLQPRQGQADPRRRRLQGHRTATASARCPAAASR